MPTLHHRIEAKFLPCKRPKGRAGRLCLQCGSENIRIWDKRTCPKCASKREESKANFDSPEREHTRPEVKCQGELEDTGEKEFWT